MSSEAKARGTTAAQYAVLSDQDDNWEPQASSPPTTRHNSDPFHHVDSSYAASQSTSTQQLDDSAGKKELERDSPSTTLHRSPYILFLVLIYTFLILFAWVITCILVSRPITTGHYGIYMGNDSTGGYPSAVGSHTLYVDNEHWYRAVRVIQAIVSTLTIPLASAVCSAGAVVFTQKGKRENTLSLRQLMVLATSGWADIPTYWNLTPGVRKNGWKRYGSSFLFLAILLNALGGLIGPLQQLFFSTSTIKTPTVQTQTLNLQDIAAINQNVGGDDNFIVALTRSALTTANVDDPQSQLWPGCNLTAACNALDMVDGNVPYKNICNDKGVTFSNISQLCSPFFAELPNGFNTGLIRQFLPRINSTADYQMVEASDFPENCQSKNGSFYVDMGNSTDISPDLWHLQACMPADLRNSPWKATGNRQDFTEALWLNVTFWNQSASGTGGVVFPSLYSKVTVTTSAGYFELPNYMNSQLAGPLLDNDPTKNPSNGACGVDCEPQFYNVDRRSLSPREANDVWNSTQLEAVRNKGPLLTVALALFGRASFPTYPSTLPPHLSENETDFSTNITSPCAEIVPFGRLVESGWPNIDRCVSSLDSGSADVEVEGWLRGFVDQNKETLSNAFTAAVFLANAAWLPNAGIKDSMFVNFDLGADTSVPVISTAGIVVISILIGVFLLGLLAMAVYASATPSWAESLDAWAMMRLGAAVGSEKVPLLVGKKTDAIKVLDEVPGWVGEVDEMETTGRIGLGALGKVRGRRRFVCYEADRERSSGGSGNDIALEPMRKTGY